jgi:CRP/FNR family cyclic AMP-dependent transcriptional regulator
LHSGVLAQMTIDMSTFNTPTDDLEPYVFPSEKTTDFPIEFIQSLPIFNGFSPQQLERAAQVVKRRDCEVGEYLITEHASGNTIFIIIQGSVKISATRNGEEVILGFRGKGELVGEISVLDGDSRSASVRTQTPCVIACITRHDFWNTLWIMPPLPYNLARLLADRVRRLTRQLQSMACLDVPGRLAQQLLALSNEHSIMTEQGMMIPFSISQIELAQMIGATRVQVNRTFQLWKKLGFIIVKRHSILIKQPEKLQQILEASENSRSVEKK